MDRSFNGKGYFAIFSQWSLCANIFFPYLALNSMVASQMAWLGLFFFTNFPNSYTKPNERWDGLSKDLNHVSGVATRLGPFGLSTDWATLPGHVQISWSWEVGYSAKALQLRRNSAESCFRLSRLRRSTGRETTPPSPTTPASTSRTSPRPTRGQLPPSGFVTLC